MRAVQKVEQIREDLGKVGPVIAEQVAEAMLGRGGGAGHGAGRAGGRGDALAAALRAGPAGAHRAAAPAAAGQPRRPPPFARQRARGGRDRAGAGEPAPPPAPPPSSASGLTRRRSGGSRPSSTCRRCAEAGPRSADGLAHPLTGERRPIVFDHDLARGRDDVVLVHLNHRLVQMALRLLRAEVWNPEGAQRLQRVTARRVPNALLPDGPAVIAHARLVVIGSNSHRLHEELISAGGTIREGRFRRLNVGQVQALLAAATTHEPSAGMKAQLSALWPRLAESVGAAIEARGEERTRSLERLLEMRAAQEAADIAAILSELARTIQEELEQAGQPFQLELDLFSTAEREQYRRNLSALEARLAEIPAEIERESEQVRARYSDPQPRLFPIALEFLVPERLA